jgi:hypothetical protein
MGEKFDCRFSMSPCNDQGRVLYTMHAFVPALFKRVRGWGVGGGGEEVLCMVYGIQGQHTRVMVESEG